MNSEEYGRQALGSTIPNILNFIINGWYTPSKLYQNYIKLSFTHIDVDNHTVYIYIRMGYLYGYHNLYVWIL